jgi:methionine-rich copper-binding protein CopC
MPSSLPAARRPAGLSARAAAVVVLVLVPLTHGSTPAAALTATGAAPRPAAANGAGPALPGVVPVHARLAASAPADGSTVATADEVVLTFSEEVNPSFVAVTVEGPGGDETDGGEVVDGRDVTQPLTTDLGAGEHVVTFRVVSADGHPVSGTVTFMTTRDASVQPPGGATASPVTPSPAGTATVPATPPASAAPGEGSQPASSEASTSTPWAIAAIGALLLALTLGGALWWSRRHGSRHPESEEPAGP